MMYKFFKNKIVSSLLLGCLISIQPAIAANLLNANIKSITTAFSGGGSGVSGRSATYIKVNNNTNIFSSCMGDAGMTFAIARGLYAGGYDATDAVNGFSIVTASGGTFGLQCFSNINANNTATTQTTNHVGQVFATTQPSWANHDFGFIDMFPVSGGLRYVSISNDISEKAANAMARGLPVTLSTGNILVYNPVSNTVEFVTTVTGLTY